MFRLFTSGAPSERRLMYVPYSAGSVYAAAAAAHANAFPPYSHPSSIFVSPSTLRSSSPTAMGPNRGGDLSLATANHAATAMLQNGILTYYTTAAAGGVMPSASSFYPTVQPLPQPPAMGQYTSYQQQQAQGEGPAQMRKLFIGGLNHETTDAELRDYYAQWGQVVDSIVIRDPMTKHSRGFGFVTYATVAMAEAAMNERPHTISGKVVDPKRAIPREQMVPMTSTNAPNFAPDREPAVSGCKLILAGIHWDYHTVDGLRQYFEQYGEVEQIEILGYPRGHGFVVYEEKEAAEKCLAGGNRAHSINGRNIQIKECMMGSPSDDPSPPLHFSSSGQAHHLHHQSFVVTAGGGNESHLTGGGGQPSTSLTSHESFCTPDSSIFSSEEPYEQQQALNISANRSAGGEGKDQPSGDA